MVDKETGYYLLKMIVRELTDGDITSTEVMEAVAKYQASHDLSETGVSDEDIERWLDDEFGIYEGIITNWDLEKIVKDIRNKKAIVKKSTRNPITRVSKTVAERIVKATIDYAGDDDFDELVDIIEESYPLAREDYESILNDELFKTALQIENDENLGVVPDDIPIVIKTQYPDLYKKAYTELKNYNIQNIIDQLKEEKVI